MVELLKMILECQIATRLHASDVFVVPIVQVEGLNKRQVNSESSIKVHEWCWLVDEWKSSIEYRGDRDVSKVKIADYMM